MGSECFAKRRRLAVDDPCSSDGSSSNSSLNVLVSESDESSLSLSSECPCVSDSSFSLGSIDDDTTCTGSDNYNNVSDLEKMIPILTPALALILVKKFGTFN